jgi:hypothetical protein
MPQSPQMCQNAGYLQSGKQKSLGGANSGKYGASGMTVMLFFGRKEL